jgi:hypothetical protein
MGFLDKAAKEKKTREATQRQIFKLSGQVVKAHLRELGEKTWGKALLGTKYSIRDLSDKSGWAIFAKNARAGYGVSIYPSLAMYMSKFMVICGTANDEMRVIWTTELSGKALQNALIRAYEAGPASFQGEVDIYSYIDAVSAGEEIERDEQSFRRRKAIYDKSDKMVRKLLAKFQQSVWQSAQCLSGPSLVFLDTSLGMKLPENTREGWYIGQRYPKLLRYVYGILIVLDGELGNPKPVFAVCHADEDCVPRAIITEDTSGQALSAALELAKTKPPIDMSILSEYGTKDTRSFIPLLMNAATFEQKLAELGNRLQVDRQLIGVEQVTLEVGQGFCPNCGSRNPGTRFCPKCGTQLLR